MLSTAYVWKKVPVLRLLLPFMAGIILQWHFQWNFLLLLSVFAVSLLAVLLYSTVALTIKYRFSALNGFFLNIMLISMACILVWLKDIRHTKEWIGHYTDQSAILVTLQEPLAEKPNSFKAIASVNFIYHHDSLKKAEGQVLLYFKKDSSARKLDYGSQIIFQRTLQPIKNGGNPGSFDYKRYSLFQGITHQVYLSANDFKIVPSKKVNFLDEFIFNTRAWVIATLQKFIKGEKEQGLAEALLIGYKDDLDKNLVQSYTTREWCILLLSQVCI